MARIRWHTFFLKVDYMAQFFENHPTPICTWRYYTIGTPNLLQELTAESVYTSKWAANFLPKIATCTGDLDAHLIHGSLGQPESTTKTAS